jgi:hydroxyethylthiazole kinase
MGDSGIDPAAAAALLARLRDARPLIHHITNTVTQNDVANVTLAIGASPVMAHAPEEVEAMVAQARALVLNLGTPTVERVDAMLRAARRANSERIPIVLDPVGAGATPFRTAQIGRLLAEARLAGVRGNAGEIAALAGRPCAVRGVDAAPGRDTAAGEVMEYAAALAVRLRCAVAATGETDVLTDGARLVHLPHGHPWLRQITGSGCMATACIGAFAAVEEDALAAAVAGLACFEIAAEQAAKVAVGPGSFRVALFDALAALDPGTVAARGTWHVETVVPAAGHGDTKAGSGSRS